MITVELNKDEINLILSAVGLSLNIIKDEQSRSELEALLSKFMLLRDSQNG
jgi:hypothetical protein